jgi:hypothetical protein
MALRSNNEHPHIIRQTLQVLSVTVGLISTIYFLAIEQWKNAGWALIVSALISLWSVFVSFIRRVKDEVTTILREEKAPLLARWIVNTLESRINQYWWVITARFQRTYYKSLIYKYRTYKTLGLTKGKFALDFQEVFIPLKVEAESLDRISSALIPHESTSAGINIWDFLAAMRHEHAFKRIAIIGGPGSGKTTLLEHITLTYARNSQRRQHTKAPKLIPILLSLRDVIGLLGSLSPPSLPDVVESQQFIKEINPKHSWFENKLRGNKCLVMLDGLDEVGDSVERKKIGDWVTCQMERYPETAFIVTSRPFGYKDVSLDQIRVVLGVLPLNRVLMKQFIYNWYLQNEAMQQLHTVNKKIRRAAQDKANDLVRRIEENPTLLSMSLNPLLLTMIATVHDNSGSLPTNRVGLYAEICEVLLGKRQAAKHLKVRIPPIKKKQVLQVLALELMLGKTREFTIEQGVEIISDTFSRIESSGQTESEFLDRAEKVSGLLLQREPGVYEFAHKSLQEYLAATQIKETKQEKLLVTNFDDPWWEETIRLYAVQSDATNLIRVAIRISSPRAMKLAYDCIDEGARVNSETREQLDEALEQILESPDRQCSRAAAEIVLARRLDKLQPIHSDFVVDHSCITCAEYQLFLDDLKDKAVIYRPYHWGKDGFPKGTASSPVTGVSFEAAKAFCEWLNRLHPSTEYSFRLPTTGNMHTLVKNEQVWSWCVDREGISTSGVSDIQVERTKSLMKSALDSDLDEIARLSADSIISESWFRNDLHATTLKQVLGVNMETLQTLWRGFTRLDEIKGSAFDEALRLALKPEHYGHRYKLSPKEIANREYAFNSIRIKIADSYERLRDVSDEQDIFSLAINPPSADFPERDIARNYVRYVSLLQLIYWNWRSIDFRASLRNASNKYRTIYHDHTYTGQMSHHDYQVHTAFRVYAYIVLTEAKMEGLISPFESIRIVEERIRAKVV